MIFCCCSGNLHADFSERYRMPAIRLEEEARQVLLNYEWPGNVRQLKNVTEQLSIIEQEREVSCFRH